MIEKMLFRILLLLTWASILVSCNDFFEQVVEVEIPEHTPVLAVTSELKAGDTTIQVWVNRSVGVLEPDTGATEVENALVEIYRGTERLHVIPFVDHTNTPFYRLDLSNPFKAEAGEYVLKVSAPGFETVKGQMAFPSEVSIIEASYLEDGALDEQGGVADKVSLTFQDPPGEDNYYIAGLMAIDEMNTASFDRLYSLDPAVEGGRGEVLINDQTFEGEKRTIDFYFRNNYSQQQKVYVALYAVSEEHYKFSLAVENYELSINNPLAEPVIIPSNIEEGFGLFSLISPSYYRLDF